MQQVAQGSSEEVLTTGGPADQRGAEPYALCAADGAVFTKCHGG